MPDLLPLQKRSVFIAPLFVPGGLRFKVPQAMLCGLPVIAPTVEAEGVAEVAPPDALWAVTDDPSEMAASLVAALTHGAAAAAAGQPEAQWCREFYSFPRSIAHVLEVYTTLVRQNLPATGSRIGR